VKPTSILFFEGTMVPNGIATHERVCGMDPAEAERISIARLEGGHLPVTPVPQRPADESAAARLATLDEPVGQVQGGGFAIPDVFRNSIVRLLAPEIMERIALREFVPSSDVYSAIIQHRRNPSFTDIEDEAEYKRMLDAHPIDDRDLYRYGERVKDLVSRYQLSMEIEDIWLHSSNRLLLRDGHHFDSDTRLYMPVDYMLREDYQAEVWKLAAALAKEGIRIDWKMPTIHSRYFADDHSVIYFERKHSEAIYRGVVELFERRPRMFAKYRFVSWEEAQKSDLKYGDTIYLERVPVFAAGLRTPGGVWMNGISFAQSAPEEVDHSFHGWLGQLVAGAINVYIDRNEDSEALADRDAIIGAIAAEFNAAGIPLDHVAFREEEGYRFLASHSNQPIQSH